MAGERGKQCDDNIKKRKKERVKTSSRWDVCSYLCFVIACREARCAARLFFLFPISDCCWRGIGWATQASAGPVSACEGVLGVGRSVDSGKTRIKLRISDSNGSGSSLQVDESKTRRQRAFPIGLWFFCLSFCDEGGKDGR